MKHVLLFAAALACLALTTRAPAQEPVPEDTVPTILADTVPADTFVPAHMTVGLTLGRLTSGPLQRQGVVAERTAGDGTVLDSWPLRRTVELDAVYQVGASVLVSLGPVWALRASGGLGWGGLSSSFGGDEEDVAEEAESIAAGDEPAVRLLSLEGVLRFRMPTTRRFAPYAEIGLLGEYWSADSASGSVVPEAAALDGARRIGAHVALGGTLPVGDRLAAEVQVASRLYRTPLRQAAGGVLLGASDSLRVRFTDPDTGAFADGATELLSVLRLQAGLRYLLGGQPARAAAPPVPVPSAPDDDAM